MNRSEPVRQVAGETGTGPGGKGRTRSGLRRAHRRAGVAVGVVPGRQGAPGRGEPEGRVTGRGRGLLFGAPVGRRLAR